MKIFPENVSSYGAEIDQLFWIITAVVGLASLIVLYLVFAPLFTRKKKRSHEERYIKGEGFKQLKWVYLAIAVMAIADFSFLMIEGPSWQKIEESLPAQDYHIAVVGKQWMWEIIYPGKDGKLYTADDTKRVNQMFVPVNAVVHMDISSYDVIHSVFIPHARFKQDALPGRKITRWVKFTKPGTYPLVCAEMCGIAHANMIGKVVVLSQEDFKKKLAELNK